jgi:isocitrate dehydrogenase
MYYVSFIGIGNDSIHTHNNFIRLAIRAVYTKRFRKWYYEKDFDEKEKERIENRFDKEIISKLEKYTGVKTRTEN